MDESFQETVAIEMSEISDKQSVTEVPDETTKLTEKKKKKKNKKSKD